MVEFRDPGRRYIFMFPFGSETDPLLIDYVHCHARVSYCNDHQHINSTLMDSIIYYADDEFINCFHINVFCKELTVSFVTGTTG